MYVKLHRSLWDGTLAGTGEVWAVFVFLLAHCDREGFVDIHPKVISQLSGFDEGRVRSALGTLEAPDPESRTAAEGGARIVRIDEHRDWGWQVVNYTTYRNMVDGEVRRAQVREAVRRHREKKASVSNGNQPKAHAEAEGDGKNQDSATPESGLFPETKPSEWKASFAEFWKIYLPLKNDGKAAALAVWMRIDPKCQKTFDAVMDGLDAQVAKWKAENTERKYIPHARTWLFQKRWLDFEKEPA